MQLLPLSLLQRARLKLQPLQTATASSHRIHHRQPASSLPTYPLPHVPTDCFGRRNTSAYIHHISTITRSPQPIAGSGFSPLSSTPTDRDPLHSSILGRKSQNSTSLARNPAPDPPSAFDTPSLSSRRRLHSVYLECKSPWSLTQMQPILFIVPFDFGTLAYSSPLASERGLREFSVPCGTHTSRFIRWLTTKAF